MTDLKLYESEYRFMDLIWEAEPVRSTELAKMARERLEWKKSTCYTVLKKLEAKGASAVLFRPFSMRSSADAG